MIILINRHIKLFFKDKTSVFFALFSVFIIIALYILFLSDTILASVPEFKDQEAFVFLWMFAGIIAVTTATGSLGAFSKYIEDKVGKKNEDFLVAKISPRQLSYSYIFYSAIIALILTALLIVFGYVYGLTKLNITLHITISVVAIVFLSTLMHTLFFYLISSTLSTTSAFSGFSTIVGTLIGFLAGIYIPIGLLPSYLQKIITLFPTTQAIVLLKNILMKDILATMQSMMGHETYHELLSMLGINLYWNNHALSQSFSWIYLIVLTMILFSFILFKMKKIATV